MAFSSGFLYSLDCDSGAFSSPFPLLYPLDEEDKGRKRVLLESEFACISKYALNSCMN